MDRVRSRTGRDLAAARVRADLRMRDVAAAMGVSKSRVNAVEHLHRVTTATATRYLNAVAVATRGAI